MSQKGSWWHYWLVAARWRLRPTHKPISSPGLPPPARVPGWKFRSPTRGSNRSIQFPHHSSPVQTEAINLSNPDFNTTYQLQARTLYASLPEQAGTDFKLALNGQPLPQHHALPLTQATRYFLSYLAPAAKPTRPVKRPMNCWSTGTVDHP
ncbi:hypothetical protein ACF2JD_18920 [Aeromonas sp. A-5]|uniref:hypothetical protein n=1 Tax=Aeromonas ichthyocola TaxID=3367746 RepID=UPI0038EB1C5D